MLKDKEFMAFYSKGIFRMLDVDHNGVVDFNELANGLFTLLTGDLEATSKCKTFYDEILLGSAFQSCRC